MFTLCVFYQYYLNGNVSNRVSRGRELYISHLNNIKYAVDLGGLFWFLVGNMWVISDGGRCDDGSAMYQLALWLIIISYAKIFLPCVLLLALLPVICFCLPCLIRVLSRLQDPMRGKGASSDVSAFALGGMATWTPPFFTDILGVFFFRFPQAISRLQTEKYKPSSFPNEDPTCCICLNEYELNQELRVLPCAHHFHKPCVDEWLVVNSTCPTCRMSIYENAADLEAGNQHTSGVRTNDVVLTV